MSAGDLVALMPGGARLRRSPKPRTSGSLFSRRRRGHLAILSALLLVTSFGYIILQPRTVRVMVDGRDLTVETRASKESVVLASAGVDLRRGDRVTVLQAPDGDDVLRVERARDVALRIDGDVYNLRTHAETIDQLLEEAGVVVSRRDALFLNGVAVYPTAPFRMFGTPLGDVTEIEIRRAIPFTVIRDGREIETTTSMATIAQALREAGIRLGPGDRVVPDADGALIAGARVEVQTARAVTVTLPDEHRTLYTFAATVGEVLADAGISTPEGAFIDPPAGTAVSPGMAVRVVQLSAASDVEREYIESSTVYRTDTSLAPGAVRVEPGHDGVRVRRYDVSYVDGVEAGRDLIDEYFESEPLDTVVYYPAQAGSDAAAPADGAISSVIRVYATWYNAESAGRPATDPAYGRTATGVQVTYGIVAVDPDVIPLGTRMFIPGYGYAVAADTGGGVKGYIIDLGYPDGVDVTWQSRWLEIYILA